jgi:hypothetical protein
MMRLPELINWKRPGLVLVVGALAASPLARAGDASDGRAGAQVDSEFQAVWKALRNADCARCHGKEYEGLAAPSIVEYARVVSRDLFIRKILDGDPARGMPGYRNVEPIASRAEDIYRYFAARASGSLAATRANRPRGLTHVPLFESR